MFTASRFLCLTLAAFMVTAVGCASGSKRTQSADYDRRKGTVADDKFASGSKRAPTAKTIYSMAKILQTQGKDSESEFLLQKIVREHPTFMPAYCDLAEIYMRQRRVDDAIAILKDGLTVSPRDAVLLNNLGMCRMIKADYAGALGAFGEAADVSPRDARYRSNMAVALGMMGRYKEAFAIYEQVMPVADAHYNLGVLAEARNDLKRAIGEFRRAETLKVRGRDAAAERESHRPGEPDVVSPAGSEAVEGSEGATKSEEWVRKWMAKRSEAGANREESMADTRGD